MTSNFHDNAAALIIAAAKQAGLLDDVAKALCLITNVPNPTHTDCPACELMSDLTYEFGELSADGVVGNSLEKFYRRESGYDISEYSEDELRQYFTVPFEIHVETIPPRFSINFDKLYDADFAKAEIEAALKLMPQRKMIRASASME